MKSHKYSSILAILVLAATQLASGTPLDDYIAKPDDSYAYSVVKTVPGPGCTTYILDMTSQSWRSKDEVDRTLWKHWLVIVKPDNATGDKALLWITGGSNNRPAPETAPELPVSIALRSGAVVAALTMVPNQPLVFPDGGRPRSEDGIIAYTFSKYIATGDNTWPLLLPMVKSAVRAMDTIQSHLKSLDSGALDIKQFVVSGGSKRGWTTWLTAAVDKRVVAIAPAVIDVLNMDEQMKHHFGAYGFYSDAIADYGEMKVFERLDTPEGQALVKFIDPYEYRNRYAAIPKCLINSSGDQFFLPDSAQFYFHNLPGEKFLRYVPNTDHGLGSSDAMQSLLVFYQSILKNAPRPKFTWSVKDDGSIEVKTTTAPKAVKLWQATNPKARDFRLEIIGPAWKSTDLGARGAGTYVAMIAEPKEGWTAFFVELTFASGGPIPYKFTTEVHVVPETLPFADKL
ncbi:MAG: PhoPQ-activated pathogenicity-related family protein [Planctomycetota bacterium]|jgi:PhoPQ-activated pathogenicity-related protein